MMILVIKLVIIIYYREIGDGTFNLINDLYDYSAF